MTFDYDYGRFDLIIYRTYIVNEAGEPFFDGLNIIYRLQELLFSNISQTDGYLHLSFYFIGRA